MKKIKTKNYKNAYLLLKHAAEKTIKNGLQPMPVLKQGLRHAADQININ